MKRVQHIEMADRDLPHHQLHNRLKYTDPREMLEEYRASNALIGRTVCPVCDYLAANLDKDVMALERTIYEHPDWGPSVLMETLIGTVKFNPPHTPEGAFIAGQVQHAAALALCEHPWEKARPYIEAVIAHPDTVFVNPKAFEVLMDFVLKNHPVPANYLAKSEVIRHGHATHT